MDHRITPTGSDLQALIDRLRSAGVARIRSGVLFPSTAAVFEMAGFTTVDTLVLMVLDHHGLRHAVATAPPSPHRPERLGRRAATQAAAVDQAAFGPLWGYDRAAIRSMRSATPMFRGRCVRVRSATGRSRLVAGYIMVGIGDQMGYIQRLAVDPRHRRRGLSRALVTDALIWMDEHSVTSVLVNTGIHNSAALGLYSSLGFTTRPEHLTVAELDLRGAPC